jgi:hypothetical protein
MASRTNIPAAARNLAMDYTMARETAVGASAANAIGLVIGSVPQNPEFTGKFDPGAFTGSLGRRTKTVVVGQNPPAGDYVPSGTAVTVTVVEKSLIPSRSFPGLTPAVVDKWPNIGALEDDIGKADTVAQSARTALDKGVAFTDLSETDQAAITNYVTNRMGTGVENPAKVAAEVAFLYQL